MIRYALRCADGHEFEGWFRSSADFDRQAGAALVSCPSCGSLRVDRALMAPAVVGGRGNREALPAGGEVIPPEKSVAGPPPLPDAARALLSRLRAEIERTCDYVGPGFADEAIRMHRGEIDKRGIYGETTESEREKLADEGVEVARIPWLPRTES